MHGRMPVIVSIRFLIHGSGTKRAVTAAVLSRSTTSETSFVQRASEDQRPLVDEPVHEFSMLVKQLLLAEILRPVPWAAAPFGDEKQLPHRASRARALIGNSRISAISCSRSPARAR